MILGCAAAEAYCYDRGCFFFSPELVRDHTKIQGNTGGSFFFTRIGSRPYQNSGKYRSVSFSLSCLFRSDVSFSIDVSFSKCVSFSIDVSFSKRCFLFKRIFLFHQNWFATIPKFREIQEGLSFSPELVCDHTKIQGNTTFKTF